MPRVKKIDNLKKIRDEWVYGDDKNRTFKGGEVVRYHKDNNKIGVICEPEYEVETYRIKIWDGPNPWNYSYGVVHSDQVYVTDEKNPTKYNMNEEFRGPSFDQIQNLKNKINLRKKEESAKDVEYRLSLLEEQLNVKRNINDDLDSNVIDYEDDDNSDYIKIDPVEKKRLQIIEEE